MAIYLGRRLLQLVPTLLGVLLVVFLLVRVSGDPTQLLLPETATPEDRAVLENEIARLRHENAVLKKDLLERGLPLPAGTMPDPSASGDSDATRWQRHRDEFAQVMALFGRMLRRFIDAVAPRHLPDNS